MWLLVALAATWVVLGSALLLLIYRRPLWQCWREPVLKAPVLIIESDDWGVGRPEQAAALARLRALLLRHRDGQGTPAVMTLALVLAEPDRQAMAAAAENATAAPLDKPDPTLPPPYQRRTLADPHYEPLLAALRAGTHAGVFGLQLHGMEHYWPDALVRAAAQNPEVAAWLVDPEGETEQLPPHLQSRWTDAATLPSRPLSAEAIEAAAAEEVRLFRTLFGQAPAVAVPPTFVWSEPVEQAWGRAGVEVVVTPGRRLLGRDAKGAPVAEGERLLANQIGAGGVRYQVRDAYFEPAWGHRAADGLAALAERTALGRATLLETHRFNFLEQPERSEQELERLLGEARRRYPSLRFLTTAALARAMAAQDPALVASGLGRRLPVWRRRIDEIPRFRRLSRLTGLALLLAPLDRSPAPFPVTQSA